MAVFQVSSKSPYSTIRTVTEGQSVESNLDLSGQQRGGQTVGVLAQPIGHNKTGKTTARNDVVVRGLQGGVGSMDAETCDACSGEQRREQCPPRPSSGEWRKHGFDVLGGSEGRPGQPRNQRARVGIYLVKAIASCRLPGHTPFCFCRGIVAVRTDGPIYWN